jgi:hypothetical protein
VIDMRDNYFWHAAIFQFRLDRDQCTKQRNTISAPGNSNDNPVLPPSFYRYHRLASVNQLLEVQIQSIPWFIKPYSKPPAPSGPSCPETRARLRTMPQEPLGTATADVLRKRKPILQPV